VGLGTAKRVGVMEAREVKEAREVTGVTEVKEVKEGVGRETVWKRWGWWKMWMEVTAIKVARHHKCR
jgi:hypothetical protein